MCVCMYVHVRTYVHTYVCIYMYVYPLVMGGIESFLSWLLIDKIPWYHGILPYSDLSILIFY